MSDTVLDQKEEEVIVDQQTMVLLFFASGKVSHKVTKEGRQIRFHFLKKEVGSLQEQYLNGSPIMVPFDLIVAGLEKWRNAIAHHSNN